MNNARSLWGSRLDSGVNKNRGRRNKTAELEGLERIPLRTTSPLATLGTTLGTGPTTLFELRLGLLWG